MSASGYKQTYSGQLTNVRFTPNSGHSDAQERAGLKKQTLDVRFYPESGHSEVLTFGGSAVASVRAVQPGFHRKGTPSAGVVRHYRAILYKKISISRGSHRKRGNVPW